MVDTLAADKGQESFEEVLAGMMASITRTVDTVTDPVTLQPVTTRTHKVVDIQIDAASLQEQIVEIHEYSFDWSVQ